LIEKSILENTLNNLKDGGNTPLTKNEVAMTQIQNAYQLYATLMAKSPYLSEEVLAELAEKENFPKTLIRDIMVANKHAGKISEVMTKLESRNDELPEYMLLQIKNAAASGLSAKEVLENTILSKENTYHLAIKTQINLLKTNTMANLSDYENVLATAIGLPYQIELLDAYLAANDTITATNKLNELSNSILITEEEKTYLSDFTNLYQILIRFKSNSNSYFDATASDIIALEALSGNENSAQVTARAILSILQDSSSYIEPLPIQLPYTSLRKAKKAVKTIANSPTVCLYPNPAKDYFTIEVPTLQEDAILQITDTKGSIIRTLNISKDKPNILVPTTDWTTGLYFYNIDIKGKTFEKGKIQILK
jgi:hypothetical protein